MAKLTDKQRRAFKRRVAATQRNAYNNGRPWTNDDVAIVLTAIENDQTIYDTAMNLGRSYYALQSAMSHTRFALRHQDVLYRKPAQHDELETKRARRRAN